jgi:hypothetical protein
MGAPATTRLTGLRVLIGVVVLAALGAVTLLTVSARHNQPMATNAVGSASSDLAAAGAAAR